MRIALGLAPVLALAATGALAACGDEPTPDHEPDAALPDAPPAPLCQRTTPAVKPIDGTFADPSAIALPANCVPGGLEHATGRWFVGNPNAAFSYEYPALTGTCAAGFRRVGDPATDDTDTSDNYQLQTWDDGTRFYRRERYVFPQSGGTVYEYTTVFTACLLPDDTLAVVHSHFDSDAGETVTNLTGTHFGQLDADAAGIAKVGELGTRPDGSAIVAYNLVIDGPLAYTCGPDGMDIVDVSTPTAPVHVAFVPGSFNDVRVVHGAGKAVAFLAPFNGERTTVIDVTDPAAPVALSQIREYSHSIQVQGTQLYLANYTNDVPIFDVSNPAQPVRLGAAHVPGDEAGIHDLTVAGDRLYVNNTTAGLSAIDISAGFANPTLLGHTGASYSHASWVANIAGRDLVLHGDEGWTQTAEGAAYLRVLDGDTASPTFLGDIGLYRTRKEVGIHNFLTVGTKAYIAYYHDGVRVVDLADPTHPREVAHYNTWDFANGFGDTFEGAVGIRVEAGLIYIADAQRGLLILRETP